jgi:hypothetical protein
MVKVYRILNIDRDKQINQLRDQRDRAEKELKEEKVSAQKYPFFCVLKVLLHNGRLCNGCITKRLRTFTLSLRNKTGIIQQMTKT